MGSQVMSDDLRFDFSEKMVSDDDVGLREWIKVTSATKNGRKNQKHESRVKKSKK